MTLKQYIYLIVFLVLGSVSLQAQDTITVKSVITGKMEVTARKQVILDDGFIALKGCYFVASVDSTLDESLSIVAPTLTIEEDTTIPKSNVSGDQNYIRAITFFEENSSDSVSDDDLADIKHAEDIQYFDGLGRLCQTKQVAASPEGFDIITPTVYDEYGREAQKYLPYVSSLSDGSYEDSAATACVTFYEEGNLTGRISDSNPYATTVFDNSPLNRVVEQYGVGADWYSNEKSAKTDYTTNTSSIQLWDADGEVTYNEGTLYVTSVTDENGTNTTSEYKDKQGQVVMKVSSGDGDSLRTAYAYDDFGLLRKVIPPLADSPSDSALCYYYTYDSRHRMITKKIPGAEIVNMVYDTRDRLVLTQDGVMSDSSMYLFTKYDALNRPVMTGQVSISDDISVIRDTFKVYDGTMYESFDSSNSYCGYTLNDSYPGICEIDTSDILTVTWYDDYDYLSLDCAKNCEFDNFSLSNDTSYESSYSSMTKGMVTGTMVMVLPISSEAGYDVANTKEVTATYYDKYGNVIRSVGSNFKGGYDVAYTDYEPITYRVLKTCEQHFSSLSAEDAITIQKGYDYDHMGRLLQTTCNIDDENEIVLNAMQYNELGELTAKYLHSTDNEDYIQRLDYDYNIRGWLTAINDPSLSEDNDVFGLKLYYNDLDGISGTAQYNGNISAMTWAVDTAVIMGYAYDYDAFNRLTAANYGEGSSMNEHNGYNNVSISSYDANGNIEGILRYYDNTVIDSLTYSYIDQSNQLLSVSDTADNHSMSIRDFEDGYADVYEYDANGNMTHDGPKNNDVLYNILNLPEQVNYNTDHEYRAYYLYDAAGTKLAKIIKDADNADLHLTEYLGSLEYNDSKISSIQTEEGRALPPDSSFTNWHYQYNLKDHLGNVRGIFTETQAENTGSVELVQKCSYYPFGMVLNKTDYSSSYQQNKYLYNGKEIQDDDLDGESLNLYDFRYRFYDPAICRFISIDRLAEKYAYKTPYDYAENNPTTGFDLDGLEFYNPNMASDLNAAYSVNPEGYKNFVKGTFTALKVVAIGVTMFLAPEVGIPWAVADITGVPVTPSPQAFESTAASVAEDVVSTAESRMATTEIDLEARAKEIHSALPEATQNRTTTAVGEVTTSSGETQILVGSSENALRPAQRAVLKDNEIAVKGSGHAEVTVINAANNSGSTVNRVAASRPICTECEQAIYEAGATPASPLKRK